MQHTPNFNLNLPEGTDLWNYLTQTNPNFATLDTLLKSVQDGTVTTATEVASGTAHAITRTLPDANVIRFTATSAWTLGDTMTIDGTPVTVVKPNGTNLQTGDYIIGSEVLGVLRATQFTVYLGAPSSLDAANIDYDNTQSALTATNVQGAIDEVNSNLANKAPLSPYNSHVTLLSSSTTYPFTYTATFDGFLNVQRLVSANPGAFLTINDMIVASGAGNIESSGLMFPVKTGDVIVFSNLSTGSRAQMIKS